MNGNYLQKLMEGKIELQSIKKWINENPLDSNVKYLTLYSIVRGSGTIERVLKEMLFDRLSDGACIETETYLTKMIVEASFNPSVGKIDNILSKVSSEWRKRFDSDTKSSEQKDQLKSLVDLRNSFAHGNSITASISDIIDYYDAGIWILNDLYNIMYGVNDEIMSVSSESENI